MEVDSPESQSDMTESSRFYQDPDQACIPQLCEDISYAVAELSDQITNHFLATDEGSHHASSHGSSTTMDPMQQTTSSFRNIAVKGGDDTEAEAPHDIPTSSYTPQSNKSSWELVQERLEVMLTKLTGWRREYVNDDGGRNGNWSQHLTDRSTSYPVFLFLVEIGDMLINSKS